MSGTPAVNEPGARTETGELKPQDSTTPEQTTDSTTAFTETKKEIQPSTDTQTEVKDPKLAAVGAPEKYEDFTLPEGVKLEGDQLIAATDLFKGLNLNQAGAQSLIDFHTAQMAAAVAAPEAAYKEMTEGWRTAAQADPEIGPHTAKIKADLGKALDTLGDAKLVTDFKEAMNLTGVGDHPAFIKVMAKWASRVIEPSHITGAGPVVPKAPDAKPASIASAMYPNLPA